ncbi:glycosyltransferase family 4 protein [Sphingomonas sp. CCH5-D11]|uniref:glycosyltransferase family 4 protein n=1 Tax=Sphingomonas sp. CCH5-D11 TaxID=1768786 RepID=UPI00083078A5|nr:glycosyltransferase family 4 protein [Sphingomonas sp. CCH5-D11]
MGSMGKRPLVMFLGLRGIGGIQGGVETHVSELIRHLPFDRGQMAVIGRAPYRRSGRAHDVGLPPVHWLPTLRHPALEALIHSVLGVLYAAIRRPRLLHIHGIGPNVVTPLARLLGLTVVSTHHGDDYEREKWGTIGRFILKRGERDAVCRAHACISISPVDADALRARYGREVAFIPNGVTTLAAVPAGATLAGYGLEAGRYALNVARQVPEKRQLDLIDAFEKAALPNVKLVLVGGADHENAYVRTLRARVAANPAIVMTGHLNGPPLAELFGNAGLFVLPSAHEGLPIVLLEAMALRRPVLVSDLPVYHAMGLPKNTILPVGDVAALAKGLTQAFANPPLPVDWSAMLARYQWDGVAADTAALYSRVLRERR